MKALPPASSHGGVEELIFLAVSVFQEIHGRVAPSLGPHLLETPQLHEVSFSLR